MVRHAPELEKHTLFKGNTPPEAPVSKGIENLTAEEGSRLQLMTRVTNKETRLAVAIANIYTNIYGSKYVKGRINETLRLDVATNGLGRRDIIDVIDAGGTLPPEYYTGQPKSKFRLFNGTDDNE